MRTQMLISEPRGAAPTVRLGQFDALLASILSARLAQPTPCALLRAGPSPHLPMRHGRFDPRTLDPDLLRGILTEQLDSLAPGDDLAHALLFCWPGRTGLPREIFHGSRRSLIVRPALIVPSQPIVPWSLPRPAATHRLEEEQALDGPTLDLSPLALVSAVGPVAAAPQAAVSARISPAGPEAPVAREPAAASWSPRAPELRWPRHAEKKTGTRREALFGLAAALTVALVLPTCLADRKVAAPTSADRAAAWTRSSSVMSPLFLVAVSGQRSGHRIRVLTRVAPENPLVVASAPQPIVARAAPEPVAKVAQLAAPAPPVQVAMAIAIPPAADRVAPSPRQGVPPGRPHAKQKKKPSAVAAAPEHRRIEAATLDLPDVLKPQ